jgi:hypothetical protein
MVETASVTSTAVETVPTCMITLAVAVLFSSTGRSLMLLVVKPLAETVTL